MALAVGLADGAGDNAGDGEDVGAFDGEDVGAFDGEDVGNAVGLPHLSSSSAGQT